MKRVIILLLTILVFLSGCGTQQGKQQEVQNDTKQGTQHNTQQEKSTTSDEANQSFPLKVTDANGYEMTIPEEPKRIVSLTLGSDEILMDLVDKSRILALTRYADDPGISNIAERAAEIAERATMDQLEKVIAMTPDLVITDTWTDPNYVGQLRDAGINVYVFKTPSNINEQKTMVLELARVTGTEDKGKEIVEWMEQKLKEVEDKLSRLKPEEKLTVMDYGEMGSSGIGTNFDDIVTRAGLINVISRAGIEGWPVISKEKIIEFNPDIIILPSWYYDQKNSLQGMIDTLKGDESLQSVNAIKNDRLIAVPNPHISAISHYVVLAVEDIAKEAYPELFQ